MARIGLSKIARHPRRTGSFLVAGRFLSWSTMGSRRVNLAAALAHTQPRDLLLVRLSDAHQVSTNIYPMVNASITAPAGVRNMSISVEIVDCAYGNAAEGLPVTLLHEVASRWEHCATGRTDRLGTVVVLEPTPTRGRYRLVVDLDPYYLPLGTEPAVSQAEVAFRVFRPGEPVRIMVMITPTSCVAIRCAPGAAT